jgi:hypothetical protein
MRKGDHIVKGQKARWNSAPTSRDQATKVSAMATRDLVNSDLEPEILPDVPIQAQSLKRLSARERTRYRRSRTLLASGEGVRALLRANISLTGLGVYEAFLAQSWAVRFDSPEQMIRLAEVASEMSQGFSRKAYGAKRVADLQARAWGELANAFRTAERLRSAQLAFGQAYAVFQRGTGDSYLKARLFDLEASLLGTLREFPLALHRLASLSNLYLELGESHLAGRAFITRALYTFYSGEAERAVQLNQEGITLLDRQWDPALFLQALHNHLLFLVDLGLYEPAKRLLFENRRYLIYRDRVNSLRLRWIEGRISYGMGKLVSAELALREARDGFVQVGLAFAPALACLELAMVLRSQDRTDEALVEVVAAREIFLSLEIYREYLGSIIFLEESLRRGEATTELIEATVAHVRRKWLQGFKVEPRQRR